MAQPEPVQLDSLPRWADTAESSSPPASDAAAPSDDPLSMAPHDTPPRFPCRPDLNRLLSLWMGNVWQLRCDAIVNAAEEFYMDRRNPVSDAIFKAAGPGLEQEVTQAAIESNPSNNPLGCRTGDAIVTDAYQLPCRKVIHTVGPRYNDKYRTAAENMLHSCYRMSLQALVENGLHTIAFSCIHSARKNYSERDGAPIALRTIRRFLERYPGKVDHVVVVVQCPLQYATYEDQLRLYFPRTAAEEHAAQALLPEDTGNEIGETVLPERMIRIATAPSPHEDPSSSLNQPSLLARDRARSALSRLASPAVPPGALDTKAVATPPLKAFGRVSVITGSSPLATLDETFSTMQGDVDARRKEALGNPEEEAAIVYERYLRRATSESFQDLASAQVIYRCGPDAAGRPTVALVASRIPSASSWPRLLLYFLKILDPITERDYTVVYFHLGLQHRPELSWLRRTTQLLPDKYKKNVKALYIVHPTWLVNAIILMMRPFVSEKFRAKLIPVYDVRRLYDSIPPQSISVPEDVLRYNHELYGDTPPPQDDAPSQLPQDFL